MRRLLLAGIAVVAMLVPASSALAAPYNTTGEYKNFNYCPLGNSSVNFCLWSKQPSGFLTIGNKTTPIVTPQVLQAGLITNPETLASTVVAAQDNNTLVKTPQAVPGGLLGVTAPTWWPKFLQDLFNQTINEGFTGVQATIELAAPASSIKFSLADLFLGKKPGLEMPVKVKLSNPFLGNSCYIGSSSEPITLKLTTGTTAPPAPNTPIKGAFGTMTTNEAVTINRITGNKLVDNSFAVPGANGCGGILLSWAIDPFVNSIVGIPSAAGKNTAVLEGEVELAVKQAVQESVK